MPEWSSRDALLGKGSAWLEALRTPQCSTLSCISCASRPVAVTGSAVPCSSTAHVDHAPTVSAQLMHCGIAVIFGQCHSARMLLHEEVVHLAKDLGMHTPQDPRCRFLGYSSNVEC